MPGEGERQRKKNRLRRRLRLLKLAAFLVLLVIGGLELVGHLSRLTLVNILDPVTKHQWPKRAFVDPTSLKILALGDSYTFGIAGEKQTSALIGYPEIVGAALASEASSAEVVNLALPAMDSGQALETFRRFLRRENSHPDIVLICLGINNVAFVKFTECLAQHDPGAVRASTRAASWWYRHSFTFRLLFFGLRALGGYSLVGGEINDYLSYSEQSLLQWKDESVKGWVECCLADDLREIVSIARVVRAVPILVTYHQETFAVDVQRRLAKELGVPLVDVALAARQADPELLARFQGNRREWHPDFCGYLAVAGLVAQTVVEQPIAGVKGFTVESYDDLKPYLLNLLLEEKKNDPPCPLAAPLWPAGRYPSLLP